jgi:hypothetical protein
LRALDRLSSPKHLVVEAAMRALATVIIAFAIGAAATPGFAAEKIRLAQSGTVTNCMMTCNSAAANCQATCLVASANAAGTTGNPNPTASTACILACSSTQINCHTTCARQSPSQ